MKIGHTPYGYRIENGKAVADEEKAEKVRMLFEGYIGGLGLQVAADAAKVPANHTQTKRMLRNEKYLGTPYYPPIITKELMEQAAEILLSRAERLGRIREPKEKMEQKAGKKFFLGAVSKKYADPYSQAEYAFSLIKEAEKNG